MTDGCGYGYDGGREGRASEGDTQMIIGSCVFCGMPVVGIHTLYVKTAIGLEWFRPRNAICRECVTRARGIDEGAFAFLMTRAFGDGPMEREEVH